MILDIINNNEFVILEIHKERCLNDCRRTAFTWTDLPDALCLSLTKEYFRQAINNKNVKGIIALPAVVVYDKPFEKAVVLCEKADELFYFLHNKKIHEIQAPCLSSLYKPMIAASAQISSTSILGDNVSIGENVVIHNGCIVLDNTIINKNCVIYDKVTIGTEGFFSKNILGKKTHVDHFGGVKIGENCIIHTGTNISRSANFGEYTTLGDNVHVGIHTNIGHDCNVGNNCDISAKVLLSGRVKIGCNCWIGAAAVISNAISVGDNASIKIGAVVIENVTPGESVSGNFAIKHNRNLKSFLKSKNT